VRIYEGSPRRKYADVLRAIGAVLDQLRMRNVMLVEVDEGFIALGHTASDAGRGDDWGSLTRSQLTFWDAEIAQELQQAVERRGTAHVAGVYELALRVIGKHVDDLQASDVMAFHQEGTWLVRCLPRTPDIRFALVEFSPEDVDQLNAGHATGRRQDFKRFAAW